MKILNYLRQLWSSFRRTQNRGISGSPYPIGYSTSMALAKRNLDVPEVPIRCIENDLNLTKRLLEIEKYSKEASKAIELLALNCFQSQDGGTGSWHVDPKLNDGSNVDPEILAIAQDLMTRQDGDEMIIGGDVLQNAVIEALFYGDSFLQLGIEKKKGEWGIHSSIFMPPLSMFAVRSETGKLEGYYQEQLGGTRRVEFHPFKIVQFSFLKKKGTRYGRSYIRTSVYDDWDNVRDASYALSKAALEVGTNPWVHTMAEGKNQQDLEKYQRKHQEAINSGQLLTHYYLLNGSELKKASLENDSLAPLVQYLLDCRKRMIPAGFPSWIFTELGYEASTSKDLHGQPAMTYAQIVAATRSMIGQGIKKAIMLELVLKKGTDWVESNGNFEITWEPWIATPGQLAMNEATDTEE